MRPSFPHGGSVCKQGRFFCFSKHFSGQPQVDRKLIAKILRLGYDRDKGGDEMDAIKTGALIAQVRKEKGITQRELAEKVYVSVQAVSKWELGKNFPDLALMEPLADELGLTVSELLAGERGEAPRDELVRDSLRLGEQQLRPKIKKWRGRFIAGAILLALTVVINLAAGFAGWRLKRR